MARPLVALTALLVSGCGGSVLPDEGRASPSVDAGAAASSSPAALEDSGAAGCWLAVQGAYQVAQTSGEAVAWPEFYASCAAWSDGVYFVFGGGMLVSGAGTYTTPFGSLQASLYGDAGDISNLFNFGSEAPEAPEPGESCTFTIQSVSDQVGAPFVATFACVNLSAPDGRIVAVNGGFRTTLGPPPR